jgi:hypothetical protein
MEKRVNRFKYYQGMKKIANIEKNEIKSALNWKYCVENKSVTQ